MSGVELVVEMNIFTLCMRPIVSTNFDDGVFCLLASGVCEVALQSALVIEWLTIRHTYFWWIFHGFSCVCLYFLQNTRHLFAFLLGSLVTFSVHSIEHNATERSKISNFCRPKPTEYKKNNEYEMR